MYRQHLRRITDFLKRAVGGGRQPPVDNSDQLLALSESIMSYGQMIQHHYSARADWTAGGSRPVRTEQAQ